MRNITAKIIQSSRVWRTIFFEPIARILLRCYITADSMTFFSLICGLCAVYFLFLNHTLFLIFMFLHLLADTLDGVLARLSRPTSYGKYLDYGTDQSIALLTLLKIGFYLHDYYAFLIAGLFVISQAVYIMSKFRFPVFFFRTAVFLILIGPWQPFVIAAYLYAGVLSAYSLAWQLRHAFTKMS